MIHTILDHALRRGLYGFLKVCNTSPLEKEILDCGAGGQNPPLALFYEYGYKTHGIDISKGDIRNIPFEDESLSFVYSINTIGHHTKADIAIAMKEIERILKPKGLSYVNFGSIDRPMPGIGREIRKGEWMKVRDDGSESYHSYYEDDEPDSYFDSFEIIRKEKRIIDIPIDKIRKASNWHYADIGYIARKHYRK
ncbi:MAG: class I SAM-dependent methyltransferase [Candidatus Hodarchaeales archaeon]|jgi:SAM-dependent methyltransferase